MICTKPPNLVSRGHGVDIVPIFIEHGPPEFPCPTQNKQLNEIIHLDLSGPDNMCPYFTDLALFPACKPQNTYNPTTEKKQPKVECRTSIAFDRRRSNGRYEPAHAFGMTPWRLTPTASGSTATILPRSPHFSLPPIPIGSFCLCR